MGLEAPGDDTIGTWGLETHEAITPACGQYRRRLNHSLSVIPERGMEHRRLADRSVYQVGLVAVRVVHSCHVHLNGPGCFGRQLTCHARMECLASYHQNFVHTQNGPGGPDSMLKLVSFHDARLSASANAL